MDAPALTHHDIIERSEPFVRHGFAVDLGRSDRSARRIAFKPRPCDAIDGSEAWSLDCRDDKRHVVERRLTHGCGLEATLEAAGPDATVLLGQMLAIDPAHHFRIGNGHAIARCYEVWSDEPAPASASLFLDHAVVQLDGVRLEMRLPLPSLRTVPAEITLTPIEGTRLDLPEDLLAVQGWDWARLVRKPDGWISKLRLRGSALRRSRTLEGALDNVARHLAQQLAEPPARFHERHRLARWGVVFRRGIPLLTAVGMIVGALGLAFIVERENSSMLLMLHYAPIALLAVAFSLQELPRFEIPPWPRRSRAATWRVADDEPGPERRDATVTPTPAQ